MRICLSPGVGGGFAPGSAAAATTGRFDARDYGAAPGNGHDNAAAIQSACDAASASVKAAVAVGVAFAQAVVTTGPGVYYTESPVFVDPGVCIEDSTIICHTGNALVFGMVPLSKLLVDPTTFRPSSASVMDGTVPAGWRGFSALAGGVAAFPVHPFSVGTHPQAATVTASLTGGAVTSFTVADAGGHYFGAPTVTVTGGGGSGARGTAVVNGSGVLTGVTVAAGGTGYTSTPTVTVDPPVGGFYSDYYADCKVITIEFCVTLPSNYAWTNSDQLFGLSDLYLNADPWIMHTGFGDNTPAFSFIHKDSDMVPNDRRGRVSKCPVADGTLGTYRGICQYDTVSGVCSWWVNTATSAGRPVKVAETQTYAGAGDPGSGANKKLMGGTGATQFLVGAKGGTLPCGGGAAMPAIYHGLRITRGKLYATTGTAGSAPVFSEPSLLGQPVDDVHMFYRTVDSATARTVSALDFTRTPGDTLITFGPLGGGTGYVCTAAQPASTQGGNVVSRCYVQSTTESAVLVGGLVGRGFAAYDCYLQGGLRGYSSFPSGYSQPCTIERSTLNGSDVAAFGHTTFLTVRGCMIGGGRESVRGCGGGYILDNVWVGATANNFANAFQFHDNAYGSAVAIRDCGVDNEGLTATGAMVDFHLSQQPASNRLTIQNIDISQLGSAAFVRLTGYTSNVNTCYVNITGLTDVAFTPDVLADATALAVTGAGCWYGPVGLESLPFYKVTGGGAANLTITHR